MPVACHRSNARQTGGARAAQKTEQHGFRLIAPRVAQRDHVHCASRDLLAKEPQTRFPSRFFQVAGRRLQFGARQQERQFHAFRQPAHEFRILPRLFAAQAVIEMQHGQAQMPAGGKFSQHFEQTDRIRAARNSHAGSLVGTEHAVPFDSLSHAIDHNRYRISL